MNNKGIKFLALAMVLAVAFSAVAVISLSDDASAAGESTYDASTKKLTLGTDIVTVTSSQNITAGSAYFVNNTSPVTLTIPSDAENADMLHPFIIFIKDSAPLVTIDNKCTTDFDPSTGQPFQHQIVYALYMVSEKNGNVLTLTNGLKADNLDGVKFTVGTGIYGEDDIGDAATWIRSPHISAYATYEGHIYRQGNFHNGLVGYYTGTGTVQQFGPYDDETHSYPSTVLTEDNFFEKSGNFLGDAHWDAVKELANQAYDTFTLTNFTGKLTQINRVVTIDAWTAGDIKITEADAEHKVILKDGLTIPAGSKLTIDAGTYATIAGDLFNDGTIVNSGTVTNNGTIFNKGEITGTGTITPSVVKAFVTVPTVSGGNVEFEDSQYIAEGTPIDRDSETAISGKLTVEVESGYVFSGWYVTFTSNGEEYLGNAVPSSAITMVPMITKQSAYTVAFIVDENVYMTLSVEPGKPVMKPADPTKEGNKFIGWYDEPNHKWDFADPVYGDMMLVADWSNEMYVSVPEGGDQFTLVVTTPQPTYEYNTEFSFTLVNGAGYAISKVYAGTLDITAQGDETGGNYSFIVKGDTSVKIVVMKGETSTESSQSKVDNDDGSQTVIDTSVVKEAGAATKIEETATTTGGSSAGTTTVKAEVSATIAAVEFTNVTGTNNAIVSETMVSAITDAVGFGGEVKMDVTASTSTVTIPKAALNNNQISEVTVSFNNGAQNSATITLPKDVLADASLGQTISIGVEDATSQPSSQDLGTAAAGAVFDLNIYGTATTEFDNPVTVSYDVALPTGAYNVRFYCVDDGTFVLASYSNGTATGTLEHFSTWAIVYNIPAIVIDDDELPPIWYNETQPVKHSNTTLIVAACAAAVAAIAVAVVLMGVIRKN